jgi:transcriptional regulator with XRE-family HTH domain
LCLVRNRQVDRDRLQALIDARRVEQGWTMTEFIAATGRSPSMIYAVLSGERNPSLLTAARLARTLGCEVEDFTVLINTDDGGNAPE